MSKDSIEIIIQNETVARERMNYAWELIKKGLKGGAVHLTLGREKRTLSQNRKMWPMLTDVSNQVDWHGTQPKPEHWKNIFTAALYQQEVYPGINGGLVVMGISTSGMKKREFAELIEVMYAFGSEKGVKWSEKSDDLIAEYMKWLEESRAK